MVKLHFYNLTAISGWVQCSPVNTWNRIRKQSGRLLSYGSVVSDEKFVPQSQEPTMKEIKELSNFINSARRLFVLTGAGISTESGIRDYRSEGVGQYAITTDRPTQHMDFVKNPVKRKRYWARNFAGWPVFRNFQPNICHFVLAEMEKYGNIHWLVTQNVDRLHHKAGSRKITELHGTTSRYVYKTLIFTSFSILDVCTAMPNKKPFKLSFNY